MRSPHADTYNDIMAGPMVEALDTIDGSLAGDKPAIVGAVDAQQRVLEAVNSIDWEATNLPPHDFGHSGDEIGERPLTPRAYADRLAGYAFGDFCDLVLIAEKAFKASESEADFVQILLDSRRALLAIAAMPDAEKSHVLFIANNPDMARYFTGDDLDGPPLQLFDYGDGSIRFVWHPELQAFIDQHTMQEYSGQEVGCPARKKVIRTAEGKKRILIDYFYDKLVVAMYGQPAQTASSSPTQ